MRNLHWATVLLAFLLSLGGCTSTASGTGEGDTDQATSAKFGTVYHGRSTSCWDPGEGDPNYGGTVVLYNGGFGISQTEEGFRNEISENIWSVASWYETPKQVCGYEAAGDFTEPGDALAVILSICAGKYAVWTASCQFDEQCGTKPSRDPLFKFELVDCGAGKACEEDTFSSSCVPVTCYAESDCTGCGSLVNPCTKAMCEQDVGPHCLWQGASDTDGACVLDTKVCPSGQ
jgi:hypothetical protein